MPRTVLLVEDNEDNRTVCRLILEHVGYDVIEAVDGDTGVRMARERLPDLILMDVSIPVIDGWEATRILKSDEETARIPIVALTAHTLPEDQDRAARVGCDALLGKPCGPARLLEEVAHIVGPPPSDDGIRTPGPRRAASD